MTLVEQVVRLRRTFHGLLTRQLSQVSELSLQQLLLLRIVHGGAARTQAEVAERMIIDAAATCRLVQRLEGLGLLVRRRGDDRRSMCLEVTEAAMPHIELLARELELLEERVRGHLSLDEAEILVRLLEKVQGSLAGE